MGDDAELVLGDPEPDERLAAALAVHDDAVEAAEEAAPQGFLLRRAPRQQVVCGEDERSIVAEEPRVELGRGEPLQVHDVGGHPGKPRQAQWVLQRLHGQPQLRAAEDSRRERIEELAPPVAVRLRDVTEPEARGDELDLGARAGECRRERVVVRWREGGWIGDDDAHRS